jgi:hypothetical protein
MNRARFNARGYKHVDGEHCYSTSTSSPVTNDAPVIIVLVLSLPFGWAAELSLQDEEKIYMSITEGFEQFYPLGWLILLLQKIYGLKQAAKTLCLD